MSAALAARPQETSAATVAANDSWARPPQSLLRFIACGSVDDGKSTLIGRLLYEAGAVLDDQIETLERDSRKFGTTGEARDFSLLVDGLAAEREQRITIDVAYRAFATPRRSFIVADTPGHEQYTRNMATGASTADLAIILIDARKGLLPQTRRHSFIVSLIGVRHIAVVVNKMDLVDFDEAIFRRIESEYRNAAAGLNFADIAFFPISARDGDNVVARSSRTPWHKGPTLLDHLETAAAEPETQDGRPALMPVQWVNRADADFRGYSGLIASGEFKTGDAVVALPSGRASRIERIVGAGGDLASAVSGQAPTLVLADDLDISRGDVIAAPQSGARTLTTMTARLLWTGERPVGPGDQFIIKLGHATTNATVRALHHAIDIDNFSPCRAAHLAMNGIGLATIDLDKPLVAVDYAVNRELGGFILIDRLTNETAAFGMVNESDGREAPQREERGVVSRLQRTAGRLARYELGENWRAQLGPALSWRFGSAALLGVGVFAVSQDAVFASAVAVADAALRPFLRDGHAALWSWARSARPARRDSLNTDGGGI